MPRVLPLVIVVWTLWPEAALAQPLSAPRPGVPPASFERGPLGEPGESCRARLDCADGLRCIDQVCVHPLEGTRCTADAHCGGELACVEGECLSRIAASRAVAAPKLAMRAPRPKRGTVGAFGLSLGGGYRLDERSAGDGGSLAIQARVGALLGGNVALLFEGGPVIERPGISGRAAVLLGGYVGRRGGAWSPKLGFGGVFGHAAGGVGWEATAIPISFAIRTRRAVVDFDLFGMRIARYEALGDYDEPEGTLSLRFYTAISIHGLAGRNAR